MKDEHIISILENRPLSALSESELAGIRIHTRHCSACQQAFRAANISSSLLKERVNKERVNEIIEPSPFFQTRVLAALHERQVAEKWSFQRMWKEMWKETSVLVSSIATIVAVMAILTFTGLGLRMDSDSQELTASSDFYSTDALIFAPEGRSDEMSNDQVLMTVYGSEGDARNSYGNSK
ncbi:MAG: hypothetical protein ACRD63_07840 [Pyrinomonadaceae bacterium]